MMKKISVVLLALTMLLCLASCGKGTELEDAENGQGDIAGEEAASGPSEGTPDSEPETDEPGTEEPEQPGNGEPQPSDGDKRLDELVAERNPAGLYEKLAAAHEICEAKLSEASASAEGAGLSEDATVSGLIAEWGQELGDVRDLLKEYEGVSAPEEDEDFTYYAGYYLSDLSRIYNMTRALAKDPELWLERYTLVPQSMAEELASDGSWPEGYFFSDRVPALEQVDGFMVSETGKEYGFEDGIEYAVLVNEMDDEQAAAYIDKLIEAGFREDNRQEMMGILLWLGRLDDSEGHISAVVMYSGSAAGTAYDPALMVQFYNYDIIGIMIDTGAIY